MSVVLAEGLTEQIEDWSPVLRQTGERQTGERQTGERQTVLG
jgi:hypothetical protein